MNNTSDGIHLSRRAVLAAAGGIAGCATLPAQQGGSKMKTELEIANEKLVNDFCADWSTRDVSRLATYLADDLVYQMFEGRPDIIGREEFVNQLGPFLENLESVNWEIVQSHVVGPLVINERIDHFIASSEDRSMHFQIAGYFLVRDGKIQIWKDYGYPGGISQVGSAVGSAES